MKSQQIDLNRVKNIFNASVSTKKNANAEVMAFGEIFDFREKKSLKEFS